MKRKEPNFESERVLLRRLGYFDSKDVYRNISDKEISEWALSLSRTYPRKSALRFAQRILRLIRMTLRLIQHELTPFESKKEIKLGVVLKETGTVIGIITLMHIDRLNKLAEAGFWIGKEYWGQGLTTEALRLALDFGFQELQLHRIYAWTVEENAGSRRVMEKCGFKLEGVMREVYFKDGCRYNRLGYGILESEYKTV
jgi:ribosomal-protein-alanine N-acetyltransferase